MNARACGRFLAEERKKNNYTRRQLAAKLRVPVQQIVLWEQGLALPQTRLLVTLSDLFGVSVGEILAGERIVRRTPERTDRIILEAMEYSRRRSDARIDLLLFGLGGFFLLFPLLLRGKGDTTLYHVVGAILLMLGTGRMCIRQPNATLLLRGRYLYVFSLLCQTAALMLEILPYGAAMVISLGKQDDLKTIFSYFQLAQAESLIYGLMDVFTVALVLLSSLGLVLRRGSLWLHKPILLCSMACLLLSVLPWMMYGSAYFSATGACVSVLLFSSVLLQAVALHRAGQSD